MDEVYPLEVNRAGRRAVELQDGTTRGRLPAARLADQTERLAAPDIEADAIHRAHCADLALDHAPVNGKMHH